MTMNFNGTISNFNQKQDRMSIFHYVDRNDDEKWLHSSLDVVGPN
ncbi:hypothetical protein M2263_000957 [Providencia alcalifaciens]|nr:hypothetical protein [Providencia alcalifaciens]